MAVNYRTELFEHTDLTPIRGEPDFESLNKMKNELKANAQNVPCTLGGGNHGFLGLVLTPAEYAVIVPGNQFNVPLHPGNLQIPPGTTGVQAQVMESNYNSDVKLYEQCVAIEKALKQQIVKAVHKDWLDPIRDPITNALHVSIPFSLNFLFNEHRDVSAAAVAQRETDTKNMSYDPAIEPIDKIFNQIQTLAEFADAAEAPYTARHIINFAYVIIKKHHAFNQSITEYNHNVRANPANGTWNFFKQYFRNAYRELREVGALTIADTPYNKANLISGIVEALQQCQIIEPSPAPAPTPPPAPNNKANAMNRSSPCTDNVVTNILSQMMTMQGQFVDLSNRLMNQNNNTGGGGNRNNGGGRGRRRGGHNGQGRNGGGRGCGGRNMYYCWSHGWCYHPGAYCRDRKEGHEPSATVDNCMNGSIEGLPPGYE